MHRWFRFFLMKTDFADRVIRTSGLSLHHPQAVEGGPGALLIVQRVE